MQRTSVRSKTRIASRDALARHGGGSGHATSKEGWASSRVVSVYLHARSEGYDARFYDIQFGDLLHGYKDRLSARDQALMEHKLKCLRGHLAIVRRAGTPLSP
jgi:hypothetical protein